MHLIQEGDLWQVAKILKKYGQLPHQKSANCHIKNRPTATSIVKKVVEFEIKTAGTILADIKNNGDDQMSENINQKACSELSRLFNYYRWSITTGNPGDY